MHLPFFILAALTVAGTTAAMSLRNLVHCVLALTVGFVGLSALYLQLGTQFVGFTQILVYVGAVAILAVFAILLTRSAESVAQPIVSSAWGTGLLIAVAVFAVLAWAVHASTAMLPMLPPQPDAGVHAIGTALMHNYVLPLEIVGLLLTAALIGAVLIAMHEKEEQR